MIDEDKEIIEKYGITWLKELKAAGILFMFLCVFALMLFAIQLVSETNRTVIDPRIERIFTSRISKQTCKENIEFYTKTSHMAGTENQKNITQHMFNQFRNYFKDANKNDYSIYTETYDALLSHPTDKSNLELYQGTTKIHNFDLIEDPKFNETIYRGFFGYSPNGTIQGKMFYVNYGTQADFDHLESLNISLKDSIVIARYGDIFRGNKVQNAEKAGCKGIIIYSDPIDDGLVKGPTYPKGPWRPENAFQRGTVNYAEGDPTTPGYPSIPGTINRIKREESKMIPQKIVAVPMSARDAKILLSKLTGQNAPNDWKGGIPGVSYQIGTYDSQFTLKMNIQNKEEIHPIRNLFAKIRGTVEPDREIILGNHRDAWVFGAVDPHGGTISFLEVVKSFAHLITKTKWRPRRTIVFASWDAEEHGLLGSTEWVEHYGNFLKQHVVAYINVDLISGLHFDVMTSPALAEIVREVSTQFTSPFTMNSTLDKDWNNKTDGYVGGGSDFVPFFHHLGISIIDLSFVSGTYGVYHSVYENEDYYKRFVDPNFDACDVMSKVLGLLVLRLSSNHLLNFHLKEQGEVLAKYFSDLETDEQLVEYKSHLNKIELDQMNNRMMTLNDTIKELDMRILMFNSKLKRFISLGMNQQNYEIQLRSFNEKLSKFERNSIIEDGIHGREWFKNVLCSTGTEYGDDGFEVFPGIMEAMRANDFQLVLKSFEQILTALRSSINFLS